MDKSELGAFLRSRRERLLPEDVGLTSGSRRRTPGLRREEVAVLAHISTEYYMRLEQGRAARPSGEVLAGIATALRLPEAESEHLHELAGTAPVRNDSLRRDVQPRILALMNRLPRTAAFVVSAAFDVIAWNHLAAALMEDYASVAPPDRNLARKAFGVGDAAGSPLLYGLVEVWEFRRQVAVGLRAAMARYPADRDLGKIVEELRTFSPEFERLWGKRDVRMAPALTKTFEHPTIGRITLDCDTLTITECDQQLVIYTAGNARDAESLALLDILGTDRLSSA